MRIKTDNTYNIDKKFDYFTIKAMVIESLQKILLAAEQEQEQGQQHISESSSSPNYLFSYVY